MEDIFESNRLHFPRVGRYGLAMLLSVGVHTLLLWLAAEYLLDSADYERAKPRTLHLKLQSTKSANNNSANEKDLPKSEKAPTHKTPQTETRAEPDETAATASHPRSDSARILKAAREYVRSMTAKEKIETEPNDSTVGAILDKALNPPREPPSVRELADGTIRVVTKYGHVYCIRPNSDPGILGPEDVLPKSVTCN